MEQNNDFETTTWKDIGMFDAHCHFTERMDSVSNIPKMATRVLTLMSTRAQDQELAVQVAEELGVVSREELSSRDNDDNAIKGRIIPGFGQHPWFSHLLWDDREDQQPPKQIEDEGQIDFHDHFRRALTPEPDERFLQSLSPPPVRLSRFIRETEQRLQKYPYAVIGEIGLDRAFRIPESPSPDSHVHPRNDEGRQTDGSREGRPLTPYKVNMEHQKVVFKTQLELAARYQRPVSVHSVQAHGIVFEVLQSLWKGHARPSKRQLRKRRDNPDVIADLEEKKEEEDNKEQQNQEKDITTTTTGDLAKPPPYPPRICLHSFSGTAETLKTYLPATIPSDVYFSFSQCINFAAPTATRTSGPHKATQSILACPADRILTETDLHTAGPDQDRALEYMVRKICHVKGWTLHDGAQRLRRNWERFVFGS